MRTNSMKSQFGYLPPKYNFAFNPYPDIRFSTCPSCQQKTGQRKLPLIIYVEPTSFVALNYTNRYCRQCNMLIGHKHEIEQLLTEWFSNRDPELIGNDYLIFGTVEKKAWHENKNDPKAFRDILQYISDFKNYQDIRMRMGGWFRNGEESPVMEPPPSIEWVKRSEKVSVVDEKR